MPWHVSHYHALLSSPVNWGLRRQEGVPLTSSYTYSQQPMYTVGRHALEFHTKRVTIVGQAVISFIGLRSSKDYYKRRIQRGWIVGGGGFYGYLRDQGLPADVQDCLEGFHRRCFD